MVAPTCIKNDPGKPGGEVLWQLAKFVFNSMHVGFHQLVSHWQRTHCCLEPFQVALRRNLSSKHPVRGPPHCGASEAPARSGRGRGRQGQREQAVDE